MIEVKNLNKKFEIVYEKKESLYDHIFKKKQYNKTVEVLKNINFSLKKGKALGVIGKNGSGKSTLLKILAGIIKPTTGSVFVKGKIFTFIELGVGFEPELTGIENIYLYGNILGLTTEEINSRINNVLSFAGIGHFAYTKLKNYSSGMIARLAFSTAMMVNPDIIIVDEILSVGDRDFREKSLKKMLEFKRAGKTIVFASHDLEQIMKICDVCILLKKGGIEKYGTPHEVITAYCNKRKPHKENHEKKINWVADNPIQAENHVAKKKTEFKQIEDQPTFLKDDSIKMLEDLDAKHEEKKNNISFDNAVKMMKESSLTNERLSKIIKLFEKNIAKTKDMRFAEGLSSELKELLCRVIAEKEYLISLHHRGFVVEYFKPEYVNKLKKEKECLEKRLVSFIKKDNIRKFGKSPLTIRKVVFLGEDNKGKSAFKVGDPLKIRIDYHASKAVKNPVFGIALSKTNGTVILGPNTFTSNVRIKSIKGKGRVMFSLKSLPLSGGYYLVSINTTNQSFNRTYHFLNKKFVLNVGKDKNFDSVVAEHNWEIR
ncbi:MAG: ABC transporter ATP-binding protein [Candidatus Omnitrophota bacterium]|nr:ABC transporter ATP-binding protein [Candidatus Omnitrophota bacterium]